MNFDSFFFQIVEGTHCYGLCNEYLNHVMFLIELLQGLALSKLEERDLWRYQPTKQMTENQVITKRNYILQLPKDGSRIA